MASSVAHRIGNIDFGDLNWEKRTYNTNRAYGDSKLANLYFAYELARKLKPDENAPVVAAAHPGLTRTELQRHMGLMSFLNILFSQAVEVGALPALRAGFDSDVQQGDFFGPSGFMEFHGSPVKVRSNARSYRTEAAQELWKQSVQLAGVTY